MKTTAITMIRLAIVALLSGCASTAYISSLTAPQYVVNISSKVFVPVLDGSSIEERQIIGIVIDEMKKLGINVVGKDEADYVLSISLNERTSQLIGAFPMTESSYTSGSVGSMRYSGRTTYTTYVPYSKSYTIKKLYADLYAVDDLRQQKFLTVWEGYIGAEDVKFERYTRSLVHELFTHFGGNYKRHTPIRTSYK